MDTKIIEKLLKIKALMDGGEDGEAIAAERLLYLQLKRYGLTIEDLRINEESEYYIRYKHDWEKTILHSCASSLGLATYSVRNVKSGRMIKELSFNTDALTYAELFALFEYHKLNYQKELDLFLAAYKFKHNLYSIPDSEKNETELTKEEIENVDKMRSMIKGLSKSEFISTRKRLD